MGVGLDYRTKIDRILDSDKDTGFEVEQTPDEDKIHGKTAGTECLLFSDAGILTLAKQSAVRVHPSIDQSLPSGGPLVCVLLDTEDNDVQNEFDSSKKTGVDDRANGEGADHLIDDTNHQFNAGDVGKTVWNTADDTYALVTAFNDAGDLTLDAAIMANAETYILFSNKFTATVAGKYAVLASINVMNVDDTKQLIGQIFKNGVRHNSVYAFSSHATADPSAVVTDVIDMSIGDYIEMRAQQYSAFNKTILWSYTWFSIVKVA